MRIEYDVKLGFKDVMFRPKRSTLKSRSQVDLNRTFKFMHTDTPWTGVPIMAANMDTVGTFEMALALADRAYFFVDGQVVHEIDGDTWRNDSAAIGTYLEA